MMTPEYIFKNWLEQHGLKLTQARRLILQTVFELHEHFDTEHLYEVIKKVSKNVSRATVYRTLPLLIEAGLVQKSVPSESRERFEHIFGHPRHVHWVCQVCGTVSETDLQEIGQLIERKSAIHNFHISEISITIKGICWKCNQNENASQS